MTILDEIRMRPFFFPAILIYLITALAFFTLVTSGKMALIGSPAVPFLLAAGFFLAIKLNSK
jgi:hypothetical protein